MHDPAGARKVAADAIEEAARRKNDPADLINIALERLMEGGYELPACRTLNDMAITIRVRGQRGRPAAAVVVELPQAAGSTSGGVDGLGDARACWDGVPPSKIADFAGEAASADATVMGD